MSPIKWFTDRLSSGAGSTEFLLSVGVLAFSSTQFDGGKLTGAEWAFSAAIVAGAYSLGRGLTKLGKGSSKPEEDAPAKPSKK